MAEQNLRVYENKVLARCLVLRGKEYYETGNDFTMRRCFLGDQNEEERCVGNVTQRGKKRMAYRLFMGRPEGKR
jgi:hypothetical protein